MRFLALILIAVLGATPLFAQQAIDANAAELRVLDRTTGAIEDKTLLVGESFEVGPLNVQLRACRFPAGSVGANAFSAVVITTISSGNVIFDGWMSSASPALNALEHPRYDVWPVRCKTS